MSPASCSALRFLLSWADGWLVAVRGAMRFKSNLPVVKSTLPLAHCESMSVGFLLTIGDSPMCPGPPAALGCSADRLNIVLETLYQSLQTARLPLFVSACRGRSRRSSHIVVGFGCSVWIDFDITWCWLYIMIRLSVFCKQRCISNWSYDSTAV